MAYFPNIIGQEHAKRILTTLYHKKHFPPLLFVGPKGVGKRTTAINFAQIINCPVEADIALNTCPRCQQIKSLIHPDIKILFPLATGLNNDADESEVLKEIGKNISSYVLGQTRPTLPATYLIPIRAIRWINQEMAYRPLINKYKIIIVIDADRMNQESANAFLKTLEEPQAQTLFILTTSRVSAILSTIRSRCQIIRFTSIPSELIINFLMQSKHISEPEAKLASIFAEGSLRKALAYIDNKDALLPSYDLLKFFDQDQMSLLDALNSLLKHLDGTRSEDIMPSPIESESTVMQDALERKRAEPMTLENLAADLLFIYRAALQSKLSIPLVYNLDIIKKIATTFTLDQIIRRIIFLLNALKDSEIHLNKKLSLFSLLANLRF